MGTTGSGRFTDYPGTSSTDGQETGSGGHREGNEQDKCNRAFAVTLEDVERSRYYTTHGHPPAKGMLLTIEVKKRIVATTQDGLIVGNLPTAYNYLAACLKDGYSYSGYVRGITNRPVATVTADFAPEIPS